MINLFIKILFKIITLIPAYPILPSNIILKLSKFTNKRYSHNVQIADFKVEFNGDYKIINKKLKKYGICVIKNFQPDSDLKNSAMEINSYIKLQLDKLGDDNYIKLSDVLIQKNHYLLKDYLELCNYELPVLNIRGRKNDLENNVYEDYGFIDLFHINKINFTNKTKSIINFANKIENIFTSKRNIKKRTSNLYYSNEVKLIRGLHIDGPTEEYKIFMYMTSVKSKEDGAFKYVPGSHKKFLLMIINIFINKFKAIPISITESTLCNENNAINILGEPGDVIITDQRGIHGGNSQGKLKKRLMLMNSYF